MRFSRQAADDLKDIVRDIAVANPNAARRIRFDISRAAATLTDNPSRGPQVGPGLLRRIVVPPYVLFYQVSSDVVTIVRVLHGAPDLGRILREGGYIEPDS